MDYPLVIRRNHDLLLQIAAALLAMAGSGRVLPWPLFHALMRILRPAESAVRRLIFIAASLLAPRPHVPRAAPSGFAIAGAGQHRAAFALFDPLKSFDPEMIWNVANPGFESGYDLSQGHGLTLSYVNATIDARFLKPRLEALLRALKDLPGQARRLSRWQARRDVALKSGGPFKPSRLSPLRPGLPPGWQQRPRHEVEAVLCDLHYFANEILNRRDSP